jgi:hypothetical protein
MLPRFEQFLREPRSLTNVSPAQLNVLQSHSKLGCTAAID